MEQSGRYDANCVTHAARVAELLLHEGKSPWIGRIRDRRDNFVGPLIPKRFGDLTWNTHYVACAGRDVYDPIVGSPVDVSEYTRVVFGRDIDVATRCDEAETRRLLEAGELYRALSRVTECANP